MSFQWKQKLPEVLDGNKFTARDRPPLPQQASLFFSMISKGG